VWLPPVSISRRARGRGGVRLTRVLVLLALLAAIACFAAYALSGDLRWRRYGLSILRATVFAGLAFFGVLILERVV